MKILHVAPWFYPAHCYGGPIQSVYALCRHLVHQGAEVRVLTTDADGPDRVLKIEKGRDVEMGGGVRVRFCRRIGREACSPELLLQLPAAVAWADVVHLMPVYSFPTIPTLIAARMLGRPVLWSPRGGLTSWEGRRRKRLKQIWESVCKLVMPARLAFHATSTQEEIDCRVRFAGRGAVVIPNGVETAAVTATPGSSRVLRLLYVGRIDPLKGIINLIEAVAELRAARAGVPPQDVSLTIAGTGDRGYCQTVAAAVSKAGLEDRIRMPGHLSGAEWESAFAGSDVLVLPSYSENFGMVVAEALARGLPVIASRFTPWRSVEEVGCGLWVENDAASLAAAIRRIGQMPLSEMGRKGREWMLSDFRWNMIAARMLQVYGELGSGLLRQSQGRRAASTAAG